MRVMLCDHKVFKLETHRVTAGSLLRGARQAVGRAGA